MDRHEPHDPADADAAPARDPLARIGERLVAAERHRRWRRARTRIAGGAALGLALMVGAAVAALPGGDRMQPGAAPSPSPGVTQPARTVPADPGPPPPAPGLAIYDWEGSAVLPGGGTVAEGLRRGDSRAQQASAGAGSAAFGLGARRAIRLAVQTGDSAVVVRALPPHAGRERPRFHVVCRPRALGSEHVRDAEVVRIGRGQPAVRLRLTATGHDRFHALTRAVALRGQSLTQAGQEPALAVQHIAIAVDDRLVSAVAIDHRRNPDGLGGRNDPVISGGFTMRTAQALADAIDR